MSRHKYKVHWFWIGAHPGQHHRTACGKWVPALYITSEPRLITCKTCKAVVYGRQEKPTK